MATRKQALAESSLRGSGESNSGFHAHDPPYGSTLLMPVERSLEGICAGVAGSQRGRGRCRSAARPH
eukprot:5802863-Prymnesium_polylepis.1